MSSSVALHLTLLRESSLSKKLAVKGRLTGQKALSPPSMPRSRVHCHAWLLGGRYTATLGLLPGCCRPTFRSSHFERQPSYPLNHLLGSNHTFTAERLTWREIISEGWAHWFP